MKTLLILACTWCVMLAATPALAQSTGRIEGVVRDAVGGVLPGTSVILSAPDAAAPRTAVTDGSGRFEFVDLPAGSYVVEASLAGFVTGRRAVRLAGGATATADLVLSLSGLIDNVTVTATKIGETDVQSTPLAVTAFSADSLRGVAIESVEDLAGMAPTLTISQNTGMAQVTIRGIGTNAVFAGSDPSSTIHLDGVYLARPNMVFADFLDVERVEVLRGPQGTLYGRNSVGGTINIISRLPTNDLRVSGRLTAGDYSKLRFEGSVSGPIVKDKVMANFAFARGTRDGFVKDLNHPGEDLGEENLLVTKGQVRFVLGGNHELLLSGDYTHSKPRLLSYDHPVLDKKLFVYDDPPGMHNIRHNYVGASDTTQGGVSAKLTLQLANNVMLTSLTAWRKSDFEVWADTDFTNLDLLRTNIHDIQRQVSEELTIVRQDDTMSWVGGMYYFDERDRQPSVISLYVPKLDSRPNPDVTAKAWALFGQGTYHLSPRWAVTAGLRYTKEDKTMKTSGGLYRLGTDIPGVPASLYAFTDTLSFGAWTPKFGVEYQVARDTLAYASATRGFKSGGFNFTAPEAGRGFEPEYALSYEVGLKSTVAGGRVRLNGAVFFNDYTDLQVQTFIRPGVIDITNAASAGITGVELEVAVVPTSTLQLLGSVSFLDATYSEYLAVGTGNVTKDAAGLRLNNAPLWSGTGSVLCEFPAGDAGTLSLRGDVSWQSQVFFTPFNDNIEMQKGYGLLHLRAGFESKSRRWELGFYVKNVAGVEYINGTAAFPPPVIGGRPGDPRNFGTQLTFRY